MTTRKTRPCDIASCDSTPRKRGKCAYHYNRMSVPTSEQCKNDGCTRPIWTIKRGMCGPCDIVVWRQKNPDANRRSHERNSEKSGRGIGHFKNRKFYEQAGKCGICDGQMTDWDDVQMDHIVPKTFYMRQGIAVNNTIHNAQATHSICNLRKRDKVPSWRVIARIALASMMS